MKLRLFIDIIKMTAAELKDCWKGVQEAETKVEKAKYMSLVYMNILFFPVYLIPLISSLFIIGSSFVYGPLLLFGLLFTVPFMLVVIVVMLKLYPKVKSNYLNSNVNN
ncbi:hypothetical protein [Alkalihalobacterium elongatum]|uniref:hypothetical protein n=1 Tax=Alkalihalobacterium elongatum TaxID=2675466 RepID=UPI001C1F743E|nr:hypothetical protein [Alkalihalobacterium elongatum]